VAGCDGGQQASPEVNGDVQQARRSIIGESV
jgi:hypothetical protein